MVENPVKACPAHQVERKIIPPNSKPLAIFKMFQMSFRMTNNFADRLLHDPKFSENANIPTPQSLILRQVASARAVITDLLSSSTERTLAMSRIQILWLSNQISANAHLNIYQNKNTRRLKQKLIFPKPWCCFIWSLHQDLPLLLIIKLYDASCTSCQDCLPLILKKTIPTAWTLVPSQGWPESSAVKEAIWSPKS